MDWQISEPYSPYSFLEQMPPHPAFEFREELTLEERIAVAGYQDMGFLQHKWEITPPDVEHPNCSVINSFLRFADFREVLSDADYDVILLASGSEVSTLVAGAELLRADGIKCRIVSVPSEGLFRSQCSCYQEEILPASAKKFGLTAGLPVNLEGLVAGNGKVWGLSSFGFSAPYKVLDEKLGFTAENVYNQVKSIL